MSARASSFTSRNAYARDGAAPTSRNHKIAVNASGFHGLHFLTDEANGVANRSLSGRPVFNLRIKGGFI